MHGFLKSSLGFSGLLCIDVFHHSSKFLILHRFKILSQFLSLPSVSDMPIKHILSWASLVEQWLRICLPMQGTQVRALVWEDPTCHGATGPVSHNY